MPVMCGFLNLHQMITCGEVCQPRHDTSHFWYIFNCTVRYADGVREILECFFDGKEIRNQYLIVKDGQLAGMGAHSYSKGSATGGSEEAAKYKKK